MLERANIKLASVVSDISGMSSQRILRALIEGTDDPAVLAQLAKGGMKQKIGETKKDMFELDKTFY